MRGREEGREGEGRGRRSQLRGKHLDTEKMVEELNGLLQQWHPWGAGGPSATGAHSWLHLEESVRSHSREEAQLQCFVLPNPHLQTRHWQHLHFYRRGNPGLERPLPKLPTLGNKTGTRCQGRIH